MGLSPLDQGGQCSAGRAVHSAVQCREGSTQCIAVQGGQCTVQCREAVHSAVLGLHCQHCCCSSETVYADISQWIYVVLSNIRQKSFRPPFCPFVTLPWILKWGGMETSGGIAYS